MDPNACTRNCAAPVHGSFNRSQKASGTRRVKYRRGETAVRGIIMSIILLPHRCGRRVMDIDRRSFEKERHLLLALVAWRLAFFAFFGQALFEAAFTLAVHGGPVAVLAKVFGYVIFVGIVLRHNDHLTAGLQQDADNEQYGE